MWLVWAFGIGAIVGRFADRLLKGYGFNVVSDILAGIVGAISGAVLLRMTGTDLGGPVGSHIAALLGALVFLLLIRLFTGFQSSRRFRS